MQFFEYNHTGKRLLLFHVNYPECVVTKDPEIFLVYAKDDEEARAIAYAHIFSKIPLVPFYGSYNEKTYEGNFLCAM